MKFACIELYTRPGRIWYGAKDGPNYLSPKKAGIDKCSFGCWTSALRGEHIPLTWFKMGKMLRYPYHIHIAPRISRISPAGYPIISKRLNRIIKKFHNLSYLTKFDVALIVVHDYSIREMADFAAEAKKLEKKPLLLGAMGTTLNHFRVAWKKAKNFKYFKIFIDNCDAFINYYHDSVSDYLNLFSDTPVVNIPQFYPFEFAKSFFESYENKERIIFISGDVMRTDHLASLLVAKKIQEKYPDFLIEAVGRASLNLEPLRNSRYQVIPFLEWRDYLEHTRKAYMIVDMDNTWTAGRVANDAAVVGTPCIGLNSGSQKRLFPDLACSDIVDTNRAVKLGIKLIEDKIFYKKVQKKAFEGIEAYSYENSVKRLKDILKTVKARKFE